MEYLQGETLGQRLKREKPLPAQESVQIMLQVCQGIQAAHEGVVLSNGEHLQKRKIIHRDLKPDNFILVPLGTGVLVKILDFGIAKVCHDQMAEQTRHLTGTNFFLGTPRYASPEQIDHQERIDERADIYSLGFILYEMLSGVDPFGYDRDQQPHSWISWAMAHTTKNIVPLRSQPGCQPLPTTLEAVVNRCLQKAPTDRFSSVQELGQALREVLKHLEKLPIFNPKRSGTVPSAPAYHAPELPSTSLKHPPASTPPPVAAPTPVVPAAAPAPALCLPAAHLQSLNQLMREAVGPIAPLLLQQTLTQVRNLNDLPQQLSVHLPPEHQAAFQTKVLALLTAPGAPSGANVPDANAKPAAASAAAPSTHVQAEPLSPDFIDRCRMELAQSMGPIASYLVQQTLNQYPNISASEFAQLLAAHLGTPEARQAFYQKMIRKSK
jgi:serine/threonine-protein kinase